jgi:hypothetical protein
MPNLELFLTNFLSPTGVRNPESGVFRMLSTIIFQYRMLVKIVCSSSDFLHNIYFLFATRYNITVGSKPKFWGGKHYVPTSQAGEYQYSLLLSIS